MTQTEEITETGSRRGNIVKASALVLTALGAVGFVSRQVEVTVTNGDTAQHQIVIRLFARAAPVDSSAYAVGAVTLAAGATGSTTFTSPLPFADIAPQILQIDGTWDFAPPVP